MGEAKKLKCIKCGCELGTIYKANLKTKCVYICKDCYEPPVNNMFSEDDSLNNLKNIFGMK